MAERISSRARLLFIVSNDFGELSSALYFGKGQPNPSILALPPRLFTLNASQLSVAALPYQTVSDLLAIVRRERPEVVFLFSGYLLAVNKLLTLEQLGLLLNGLRAMGCRVVTSDPFLGLLTNLNAGTFNDAHPQKPWLMAHFSQVNDRMRGLVHLYPVDVRNPPSHPSLSFYNEHIVVSKDERAAYGRALERWFPALPPGRRWMFVLSAEDYLLQTRLHGKQIFDFLLVRKMREAVRAGAQPVLVAPTNCAEAIGEIAKTIDGAILLPFCHHEVFLTLLLDAEHAFYWNIFSNSIQARVANELPVVFFDPGHMAYAIPPLRKLGVERHYNSMPLPFMPATQELNASVLADLASGQRAPFDQAMANLRRLAPVADVIEEILARPSYSW